MIENEATPICYNDATPMIRDFHREVLTTSHGGYIYNWVCPTCGERGKDIVDYNWNGVAEKEYYKQYPPKAQIR